ncbi:MAG: SPOR domain-containing protein [Bacteroidales bacterium]|nr:SPOR domain-containing protein [Bacteroidales bacterium]MDY0215745.1 SPOR domain-containing protein [Bacteroidales bacterium]
MKIASSILKLLIEDNEVSIRNFGMFYKELENASIHPITKDVSPPSKKVMFTRVTGSNPERFEDLLATENNISLEEAKSKLQLMVNEFNDSLKTNRKLEIEDFADIKLNIDNSFDVVVKKNLIFDKEYFSLPAFQIQNKPEPHVMDENNNISNEALPEEGLVVSAEKQKVETPEVPQDKKKKKSSFLWILLVFLFMGALLTLGYLYQDDVMKIFQGEEKAIVENVEADEVELLVEEPQIDYDEEVATPEEVYEEPIVEEIKPVVTHVAPAPTVDLSKLKYAPKNGEKYYVIAGSFKRISNAANLVSQLEKRGYNPVVMAADEKGLIRVAYKPGFETERKARDLADELYENKNELPWILKY